MIKVDLITGFLGSGKTTFLKLYAKYFIDQGQRVGILENDYGAVNVDMLLLNDLRSDKCELEMVAGACDADCHKRRFKTKLISMGMCGYDRVIIEPSGIFDVDEFFDSLREEPLERWYEIGNVISIVDARLENTLSDDSDFYLASQIANAGIVLLSRTQLTDAFHIDSTKAHLHIAAEKANLKKNIDEIIFDKAWDSLTTDDLALISNAGYSYSSYVKRTNSVENKFTTLYFLELPIDLEQIKVKAHALLSTHMYGDVVRIKGFTCDNGQWYQLNATKNDFDITPMSVGQEVFIVIGENLDKESILAFFEN